MPLPRHGLRWRTGNIQPCHQPLLSSRRGLRLARQIEFNQRKLSYVPAVSLDRPTRGCLQMSEGWHWVFGYRGPLKLESATKSSREQRLSISSKGHLSVRVRVSPDGPNPARYVASNLSPVGKVPLGFFSGGEWPRLGKSHVTLPLRVYHVI